MCVRVVFCRSRRAENKNNKKKKKFSDILSEQFHLENRGLHAPRRVRLSRRSDFQLHFSSDFPAKKKGLAAVARKIIPLVFPVIPHRATRPHFTPWDFSRTPDYRIHRSRVIHRIYLSVTSAREATAEISLSIYFGSSIMPHPSGKTSLHSIFTPEWITERRTRKEAIGNSWTPGLRPSHCIIQ